MILKASQRANSAELAKHLLNGDDNDHVTVHEIRGFMSATLEGALQEAYAMSRGTRCEQFLFSLSLSPPEDADVPIEDFEAAIEEIEKKLLLLGQPRIVVFHEKSGRRHCHVVWSRIDTEKLVAVNMAHFKKKLMDVSRGLFLRYGWKLPKGMQRGERRSPFHLTMEEHRQAVRLSHDPQAMKALFKGAWEQSDTKETFIRALEERGFLLARGDQRGFVALDVTGGVYSLTRWLDIGTRDLKSRLGPPEKLPDIASAKTFLAERMGENLQRYIAETKQRAKEIRQPLVQEIRALVAVQRKDRAALIERQEKRWTQETRQRAERLPRGFKGIWHRASGAYKKVRLQNEAETKAALDRDRKELHALVREHLLERQELQKSVNKYKEEYKAEALRIRREIARYVSTRTEPPQTKAKAAAGKAPLAAQLAQLDAKISLLPADLLRQELAKYTPAAADTLPPAVATADVAATPQNLPRAAQLAQVETRLALLTGDLSKMQAALESNLISDEMRGRIRRMIDKTLETLQLKEIETKTAEEKAQEKSRAYQQKQAEFNEYVRQYAVLQLKVEEENRRRAANREFMGIINNMSYALNGLPRWQITVMEPPPQYRLDERDYLKSVVRQRDDNQLLDRVFRSPENECQVSKRPPIDPKIAVPNLRR
ncbi:MAG: hypothetical protein IT560_08045, partial [Alphaproteobacteria bacterium]|nr:hypothetical protein [Alphaproteobacteria bacterium]